MSEADKARLSIRRRFESALRAYAREHGLLPAGERALVAVSGGPDSTALLLALDAVARRGRFELAAAYFDHGLRGEEASKREEAFVRNLTLSLGVSLYCGSGDVRGRAQREHLGIEEAARAERYAFLANVAQEARCGIVATGHTASDQAETVLMHVMRGSGLAGLSGIAPRSPWPFPIQQDVTLVRPLLRLTRADTLAYCATREVEPLQDESNLSSEYTRNRVRQELLPLMRQYNPNLDAALVRLADAAREDDALLEALASKSVSLRDGVASLDRERLRELPPALASRALMQAVGAVLGDRQGLGEAHLKSLQRLVSDGQTGDRIDLPRGLVAELERESLSIRQRTPEPAGNSRESVVLSVPGAARLGGLQVFAGAESGGIAIEVDAEALGGSVTVRGRRPGDRFQPLGMSGSKKLQDFFVDEHIPRSQRDAVPIFETQRGIIWVGGLRIADWARPLDGRPTVRLAYSSD